MRVHEDAAELAAPVVMRWEGFSATPYVCPAGYWTIGYGRRCERDEPPTTQEREAQWTLHQLAAECRAVAALSPVLLKQPAHRLAALASFTYNLGVGRYKASTLRIRVNERRWVDAALEFERWVMAGGRKLPGLVARRADESALFAGATNV